MAICNKAKNLKPNSAVLKRCLITHRLCCQATTPPSDSAASLKCGTQFALLPQNVKKDEGWQYKELIYNQVKIELGKKL